MKSIADILKMIARALLSIPALDTKLLSVRLICLAIASYRICLTKRSFRWALRYHRHPRLWKIDGETGHYGRILDSLLE